MKKLGIIGYGHAGKLHEKALQEQLYFDIVATFDPDPKKKARFTSEKKFWEQKPDIVAICTPNFLHHTQYIAAAERQVHVIVEKPMCNKASHLEGMATALAFNNGFLYPVVQNRYSELIQKTRKAIKEIGKIYKIDINAYWNRGDEYYECSEWRGDAIMDGGALWTQFYHFIDLVYYLFGKMEVTAAKTARLCHQNIGIDDTGFFNFTCRDALGTFNYTTCTPGGNYESAITIIGEHGTIEIAGQYMDTLKHWDVIGAPKPTYEKPKPNDYGSYKGSASNHHLVYRDLQRHMEEGEPFITNYLEQADVINTIQDIYNKAEL